MTLTPEALKIDATRACDEIAAALRRQVMGVLKKRGVVLGLSGGIDSSVCAALAVRALGRERVFGLFLPERSSHDADDSLRLGKLLADHYGISSMVEDIGPALEGMGCYRRQIEAAREVVPEYGPGWKCKLTLPSVLAGDRLNVTYLTAQSPEGETRSVRLTHGAFLALVAATNMKQRTRKLVEYTHADRLNYAVIGTPNRLEYDQGFFVKQGDGAADVKPIAHLYKSQVYALAAELGVPEEIRSRPPTTDTYSLPQTQEEFYFALPYHKLDLCLYAHDHGYSADDVAPALGLTGKQVEAVFRDIESKRRATRYLHLPPLKVAHVASVEGAVEAAIREAASDAAPVASGEATTVVAEAAGA